MGKVRRSSYRQPVTPKGLESIEKGSVQWFDTEMYSNLNTEVLEEYLDEKNGKESFQRSHFSWSKLFLILIVVGLPFTLISQYIALKIGLVTGGAFYVSYLVGMARKWKPTQVNIASGSATAVDRTVTGFVFTFPAIYLLAYSSKYVMSNGEPLIPTSLIEDTNIVPLAIVASFFASIMGLMYFIIFRRLWQVEDPLPSPGFQAFVKLLDISNNLSEGGVKHAFRSIKLVFYSFLGMFGFAFIRDFPFGSKQLPILTYVMQGIGLGNWYSHGRIHIPFSMSKWTHISYEFTGIGFAIGWFLKFRAAFIVAAGSFVTWFFIVPMAVWLDVPIYIPILEKYAGTGYVSTHALPIPEGELSSFIPYASPAFGAAQGIAKIIAIGAILGGGTTALIKMIPTFKTVLTDITKTTGGEKREWVPGKGWYEWPTQHIWIVAGTAFLLIFVAFWLYGGFPWLASLAFSGLLVALTFLLGAIAVKISGEVGTTPVSGTSFLTLLLLFGVFTLTNVLVKFDSQAQIILMALVGTTVFGSAISLSSEIMWDFKAGLYAGTRPMHLIKGESVAILIGTPAAALAAVFFSTRLASGDLALEAPQAHAFAVFVQILAGGKVMFSLFFLGMGIGILVELLTGMGTAFGLGMYLPLQYTLMMITGGGAREIWERKWLNRKAKQEGWEENQKTFRLLDSYMIMTGLYIAEAIIGTLLAIWLVSPLS